MNRKVSGMPDPPGDRSPAMRLLGEYGGQIVAGLGFVITRFFVAEAVVISGGPLAVAATVGSLVVGLALTIAGVALAVGAFSSPYVADISRGCLLGVGAVTAALALTVAAAGVDMVGAAIGTRLLVANVLLAGAVGGMLNGHRKASLRRRRTTIMRGANRARFINRLLRHEVLNAATIIDGHAELLRGDGADRDRSVDAIRRGAARIESTVNGVGTIADDPADESIPLAAAVHGAVDSVTADETLDCAVSTEGLVPVDGSDPASPDAGTDPANRDGPLTVRADDRLSLVFERLIEHAADVRGAERVRIEAAAERHAVSVTIADDGSALSDRQRDVLERGSFPEYDDPTNGFALQAASLLLGEYDGSIRVDDGDEPRITVRLPRTNVDAAAATVGVEYPALRRAVAAGLGAGVVMGGLYWATSDALPVIGALYGVESVAVGWITHLFHSVVFALLFVAGASRSGLGSRVNRPLGASVAGLAWGVTLWLVAAGLIMPLWLRGVGVPATLPNLPRIGLVGHGLWGVTLGLGYVLLGGRFD
jgi:two-component system OmpR family sensor kinase